MVTTAITASQASVFADMSGLCLYRLMDFFFKSHTNFVIFYRCKQRQTLLVHHTPQSLPANSLWLSLYLLLQWTFFLTDKTRLGNPLVCLCPRNKYFLLSYHFIEKCQFLAILLVLERKLQFEALRAIFGQK